MAKTCARVIDGMAAAVQWNNEFALGSGAENARRTGGGYGRGGGGDTRSFEWNL